MSPMQIVEVPPPPQMEAIIAEYLGPDGGKSMRFFQAGYCSVIFNAAENVLGIQGGNDFRTHLSVSHPRRLPTWDEMMAIKDALAPDVFMCVPQPPREYWVSIHDFCLHMWEIKDGPLIEQWKLDGSQARERGLGQ